MSGAVRPATIRWFELFFGAAYSARLLNIALQRKEILTGIESYAAQVSWPVSITVVGLAILLPVLCAWLAARRGNRVATWLLAIWMILHVSAFVGGLWLPGTPLGPKADLGLLTCVLYVASAIALMMPASRAWLAGRRAPAEMADEFA